MTISEKVRRQKQAYKEGINLTTDLRKKHLERLRKLISEHESELCAAISADLGKPAFEAYTTEIYTLLHEVDVQLKNLKKWVSPVRVKGGVVTFPSKSEIRKQPFGTVLIIGAWNYPVHLTLMPLAGALAAGNTVILKPSELSPKTSDVIRKIFQKTFDPGLITVIEGGVEETTELLKQPFDKIFFTGSTRVGKIVMKAAAEQLIPVTLELGGKSPAIVHKDADIGVSARRIWWGKTINAGQTCVAPDFAAVHESVIQDFITASKNALSSFFPDGCKIAENYTAIVNEYHFKRLSALLPADSKVIFSGRSDPGTLLFEPVMIESEWEDTIMEHEIFGPILPLITYSCEDDLINKLSEMASPLALYIFSNDSQLQEKIIQKVPFGGGCINDTITHLVNPNLPFGGVGNSGMGSYHGKYSFDTFSRDQAIMKKNIWPDPGLRYMPYDETKIAWFKRYFS